MDQWRRVSAYAHWDWTADDVWVWGDRVPDTNQQWVAVYTFKDWELVEVPKEELEEPESAVEELDNAVEEPQNAKKHKAVKKIHKQAVM